VDFDAARDLCEQNGRVQVAQSDMADPFVRACPMRRNQTLLPDQSTMTPIGMENAISVPRSSEPFEQGEEELVEGPGVAVRVNRPHMVTKPRWGPPPR
jgi:hypothetical protein